MRELPDRPTAGGTTRRSPASKRSAYGRKSVNPEEVIPLGDGDLKVF
jgi:hypothetical protein